MVGRGERSSTHTLPPSRHVDPRPPDPYPPTSRSDVTLHHTHLPCARVFLPACGPSLTHPWLVCSSVSLCVACIAQRLANPVTCMHARLAMPLMALTQMRGEGCALLHAEGGVKGARGGAWSGEGAAGATGMVGGGRHHTHPPSADLRRGRSTHTLPPFCPCYHHTIPPKNLKPCGWAVVSIAAPYSRNTAYLVAGFPRVTECSEWLGPERVPGTF